MDSFTRFLNKLRELIKSKVKDADLTPDEFEECVKKARGHIGGTIRWENAKAGEDNQMNEWKLLSELSLAEDKKTARIQIFPRVQKYDHPRYGELDISPEFLKTVKANFDTKVYQQDLPLTIDLEHETKLSGAAGWIKDVEISDNAGMFATVEFNDRGQALVADGGYKYFSPEFYDSWMDPATGKQYSNVLIGGALTNRPFFKGMAPVAMMRENSLLFVEAAEDGDVAGADKAALDGLSEYIGALTSFEDGELTDMSPAMLDGLMDAIDTLKGEVEGAEPNAFAGGHATHKGQHASHGGSMGPIAKKAARKRVLGKLEGDRAGMLKELKTLRTMKMNSAAGESMRAGMIKAAQGELAKTRSKMVAARAKYRSERFAEGDMDMMGMMQEMMAKMKAMMSKGQMPDEEMMAEMDGMMAKMRKGVKPGEKKASDPPEEPKLADANGGENMGMTEEQARQFAEAQTLLKSLSERVEAAEAKAASEAEARTLAEEKAKTALESVANLERSAQRKAFSEHVKANRLAYQGEVEEAVDRLERLSKSMSAEDFSAYMAERELWHKQMGESKLFTQIGHNQPVASGVEAEFQTVTRKIMSDNPGMSEAEASVKAAEQNPQLYKRYDDAHKARARRGGE